jgi:hypothetical protein
MSFENLAYIPSKEKRHTELLLYLWQRLRGKRLFPSEDTIDFEEIVDLWGACFLVQVRDITCVEHYNYTYLGEKIFVDYQTGLLPQGIPRIVTLNAADIGDQLKKVMIEKQPHFEAGSYALLDGKEIRFRQCLLPLGPTDDEVHSVIGRLSFKIVQA